MLTFLVPWEKAKLKVPTEALPWPKNRHERMSINSFGIGGSNVHVCGSPIFLRWFDSYRNLSLSWTQRHLLDWLRQKRSLRIL